MKNMPNIIIKILFLLWSEIFDQKCMNKNIKIGTLSPISTYFGIYNVYLICLTLEMRYIIYPIINGYRKNIWMI